MNVWYASYGSNISHERFMCYITGDKPPGSDKKEKGCRNQTPPKESVEVVMPYSLYFAKERSKWGEGGVAFIDHKRTEEEETVGRMYLITDEQFCDVVAQENNRSGVEIDLQQVMDKGYSQIGSGWYGRIIYIGDKDGAPIFTFTNNEPMADHHYHMPAATYIRTIANGMVDLGYSKEFVVDYFSEKRGIAGDMSKQELDTYIFGE